MKIKILSTSKGFTMIELLLVAALLLSTSVCVFSSFSQGIKIFYRLNTGAKDEEIAFLLEKVTMDLKDFSIFSQVRVDAKPDHFSFPIVDREAPPREGSAYTVFDLPPAVVTYFYDEEKKEVIRVKQSFPFNNKVNVTQEVVGHGIRSFQFEPVVKAPVLPLKMSVRIEYGDKINPRVIQKDVLIPIYYGNKT